MISLHDIHVTFHAGQGCEKKALQGLDLQMDEGDFVCVIGGNGAGKSTLLNVLCGDVMPAQGRIDMEGDDVTRLSSFDRARYVARVFQDPMGGTCPNLSIEENMALAFSRGKRRRLSPALAQDRRDFFRDQLKRLHLNLEDRLETSMGLLSGGQRQAVSLLMATLAPMKILALDEHTAALDPKTAAFILDLTREIVAENKLTTLMVTHSMTQALDLGNRTVMLHEGRVIFDVRGEDRQKMTVNDLLDLFHKASGSPLEDDDILLS